MATLCTLNVNGIRSAERRGFSRWLRESAPDYLCLQEVRAQPDDVEKELHAPPGYQSRWLSAEKKGYAGVAFYSRSKPKSYTCGHGFDLCADEGRAVRADFRDMSIITLYIPSGSSSPERQAIKFDFLERLKATTRALLAEDRPIAICGDLNIAPTALDLARPKPNEKNSGFLPEERAWFAERLADGWVDVVRAHNPGAAALYSWWSNRGRARENDVGWRIDHVLATPSFAKRVRRAWIEKKAGLSDHAPVWVEFK